MKTHAEKCRKGIEIARGGAGNGFTPHEECTCDSYHTFDELYDHRIELYITLCRHMHELLGMEDPGKFKIWRSKLHSDGTSFDGWFALGIGTEAGKQITYHIPIARWDDCEYFAETLEKGPKFDGHTSTDVLERLRDL